MANMVGGNVTGGPNGPYENAVGDVGNCGAPINAQGGINVNPNNPQQQFLAQQMAQRGGVHPMQQGNRPGVPIGMAGVGNDGSLGGLVGGPQQLRPPQMGPNPQENAQGGVMRGPRPPQTGGGPQQNQILHQQQQQPGTSQQSGGGTAGGSSGGNTGSGSSGGGQHLSEERKIQQQLVETSQRLESLNPNREKCIAPYCKSMKNVLAHMVNSKQGRECSFQHCTSSRQILLHYKTGTRADYIICFASRQQQPPQMGPNPQENAQGGVMRGPRPPQTGGGPQQNQILHQQQQQPGTSQQSGGGTAGGSSGGNTGSGSSGGGQHLSEERKKHIQQQLAFLLHAHKCNRRGSLNPNREKCIAPYCKPTKDVLAHMVNCKQGRECSFQHCTSSRQILLHYNTCTRSDCIVCFPFPSATDFKGGNDSASNNAGTE